MKLNAMFFFSFHSKIFSCESHARAAAADFAKSCVHYINTNLPGNVQVSASHADFMKRFIECFSEHFETEFARRRATQQKPNGTAINSIEEEPEPATESATKPSKPFFRRLSFKGLRKGKVRCCMEPTRRHFMRSADNFGCLCWCGRPHFIRWHSQHCTNERAHTHTQTFSKTNKYPQWLLFSLPPLCPSISLSLFLVFLSVSVSASPQLPRVSFSSASGFSSFFSESSVLYCYRHCSINITQRTTMHRAVGREKRNCPISWSNAEKSVKLMCWRRRVSTNHRKIKNGKSVSWRWWKQSVDIYWNFIHHQMPKRWARKKWDTLASSRCESKPNWILHTWIDLFCFLFGIATEWSILLFDIGCAGDHSPRNAVPWKYIRNQSW